MQLALAVQTDWLPCLRDQSYSCLVWHQVRTGPAEITALTCVPLTPSDMSQFCFHCYYTLCPEFYSNKFQGLKECFLHVKLMSHTNSLNKTTGTWKFLPEKVIRHHSVGAWRLSMCPGTADRLTCMWVSTCPCLRHECVTLFQGFPCFSLPFFLSLPTNTYTRYLTHQPACTTFCNLAPCRSND